MIDDWEEALNAALELDDEAWKAKQAGGLKRAKLALQGAAVAWTRAVEQPPPRKGDSPRKLAWRRLEQAADAYIALQSDWASVVRALEKINKGK